MQPTDPMRPVPGWRPPKRPGFSALTGHHVTLERLHARAHADDLYDAFAGADHVWDYLPYGPFAELAAYSGWVSDVADGDDPMFFAIRPRGQAPLGVLSLLRIAPEAGSIEVGHINMAPALQRTPAATEAIYLCIKWAFEAGYRRFEWKCNAANLASRHAAERFGLSYEGVFRQAAVIKGCNRDTAWFAAIDSEWPALSQAYEAWLSPGNFDGAGRQRQRLRDMTRPVLGLRDPTAAPGGSDHGGV